MEVVLERDVEAGTDRGGEDLLLLLQASFTGSQEDLVALLDDTKRLRQVVVSSFDDYRGENGDEVDLFETEEEVNEYQSRVGDYGFWKEYDADEVVELFWVYPTGFYNHEFDKRPAEELFDWLTQELQKRDRWSSNLADPSKWAYERTVLDRTGNAD